MKEEKIKLVREFLVGRGWSKDSSGNLRRNRVKNGKEKTYKVKFTKTKVRYEVLEENVRGNWIRLQSGFYKDIFINEAGKIDGLKR